MSEKMRKVITDAQAILATYIVPDSDITEHECVNQLLGLLDGPQTREALSTVSAIAQSTWVEAEKAKADAYEAAARICEEMSYPPDGQERWHGTDNEWAAIKLEDAAKAIRERKAKVCHVTSAIAPMAREANHG